MTEVTHRMKPVCPVDMIRTTVNLEDNQCVRINAKSKGRELVVFSTASEDPILERAEFGVPAYIIVCSRKRGDGHEGGDN